MCITLIKWVDALRCQCVCALPRIECVIADAGMSQRQSQQQPPIEHNLPCTLEELYKGSTRKMKISRTVHNAAGRPERISEILSIDIKPGWKKGTRITFPEKGESGCACLGSMGSVEAGHEAYPMRHTNSVVQVVRLLLGMMSRHLYESAVLPCLFHCADALSANIASVILLSC